MISYDERMKLHNAVKEAVGQDVRLLSQMTYRDSDSPMVGKMADAPDDQKAYVFAMSVVEMLMVLGKVMLKDKK